MRASLIAVTAVGIGVAVAGSAAAVPPPPLVDHTEWAYPGELPVLRVYPTPFGRMVSGQPDNDASGADAWLEVLASAPGADTPGMREQFLCHWRYAEFALPGKHSWNLEPWRPVVDEVTMLETTCNPGGPEDAF